ncbi:hypothetical protein AAVH_35574 [Aphelenchoides avenae]|nr:hypothetical protein AAVH_35574 [Aphelenchus avenae]
MSFFYDGYFIVVPNGLFPNSGRTVNLFLASAFTIVLHTNLVWTSLQFFYRYRTVCRAQELRRSYDRKFIAVAASVLVYNLLAAAIIVWTFSQPALLQKDGDLKGFIEDMRSAGLDPATLFGSYLPKQIAWVLLWTTSATGCFVTVVYCQIKILRHFQINTSDIPQSAKKTHSDIHRALLAMAICPIVTTCLPSFYFVTCITLRLSPGPIAAFAVTAVSSVTWVNPIATICFVRSYRRAVISIVTCGRRSSVAPYSLTTRNSTQGIRTGESNK